MKPALVAVLLAAVALWIASSGPAEEGGTVATRSGLEDAPTLFHAPDGTVTARWISSGETKSKRFVRDESITVPGFEELLGTGLVLAKHTPDAAVWDLPERVLAISDFEGRFDEMLEFLTANGVVDEGGKWSYGTGHLVCVGDMVDRGDQVTETLWLMYRLAREARAAGGHVHYVLGNHEAMLMGGDVRYVHPKYRDVALAYGIPIEGLVGADTELGRWMRTRNAVVRLGRYVFVHAGVAPERAAAPVDYDALNTGIRAVLGTPPQAIANADDARAVWGRRSVLWYRGYFAELADEFGPTPTATAMDAVLENLGGRHIVIGHTKVRRVTPMFGGRVIAIDIPWTAIDDVRGLLITRDALHTVDRHGTKKALALPERK